MLERATCLLLFPALVLGLNLNTDLGATAADVIWSVVNSNGSVQAAATVPGGIYTDLRTAGVLTTDFYYRFNDHEYRWVGYDDWTYTRTFRVSADYAARAQINLVFDGLDTMATVTLNGQQLGSCDNMFRRYVFSVKQYLNLDPSVDNVLVVSFRSAILAAAERSDQTFVAPACVDPAFQGECHANQIRKMQASFSWDWGPAFPSVGIWKNVYLEAYDTVLIRDTVYTTTWLPGSGRWSVSINARVTSGFYMWWNLELVAATVHAELPDVPTSFTGNITIYLNTDFGYATNSLPITVTNESGEKTFNIVGTFLDTHVKLWWPNGLGEQPLYSARVNIASDNGDNTDKQHRLGYRFLSLVQQEVFPGEPDKGLSFYFLVNGVGVFAKGSNWIPAHVLPELGTQDQYYENLLHASVEAGFNMLRVWGGGIYEADRFYEICDELGILVWQDFLFACSMYPVDSPYLDSVRTEVRDQVRRLQHHASIALWAGNNENEAALVGNWYGTNSNYSEYKTQYIQLYVDTMRPVVLTEDTTRSYAVSSPSNGIKSEQDGYIADDPYSPLYGDIHYYNYLSDGWDANVYPRTRFASEFGFQSLCSLRALRAVTQPGDLALGINSEILIQRQHHPGGNFEMERQVQSRLLPPGQYDFGNEQALAKFIPLTQIYHAMATKTEAECHRRWRGMLDQSTGEGYTMGSLYWMINDIWQAPTWSGIEHDGTWKMLHYYAAKFYANLLISPYITASGRLSVHAANDLRSDVTTLVQIDTFSWSQINIPLLRTSFVTDVARGSAKELFDINLDTFLNNAGCGNAVAHADKAGKSREACFLVFRLLDERGEATIAEENFLLPSPMGDVVGITKPNITLENFMLSSGTRPSRYVTAIDFNVRIDAIAPFVWLEVDGISGRFSDNGFVQYTSNKQVTFYALEPVNPAELQAALSVTSLLDHWF